MVENNQQYAKHKSNMRISWVSILVISAVCLAACAISQNFADFTLENSNTYHQAYHQNSIIQTTNSASSAAFIQSSNVARYVLSSIRNARSRLYDDRSTYFNGVPLQDYVSRYGLTKEAYVNNIQYDSANEEDAFRRAQETAQHGQFGHFGPDGVSEPDYTGRKAWGENLSWGVDLAGSMQLWIQDEESALRATGGSFNEDNGHLYQILNPSNISFGYGEASGGPYGVVGALTLSEYNGDIDYPDGKIGPESPEEQKKRAEEERKKKEEQKRKDEEAKKKKALAKKKHLKHKHHKKLAKAMKKNALTYKFIVIISEILSVLVLCAIAAVAWIFLRRRLISKNSLHVKHIARSKTGLRFEQ